MSTLAQPPVSPTGTFFRKLLLAATACLLLAVSLGMLAFVTTNEKVANRDFIEYWAAGQQFVHGANPYDANRIFALERSAGKHAPAPIIMFNPPSAVFLTLPLGYVSPRVGYLLWSLLLFGAWLGSIHLLWIMNGRSRNARHFIGYFFAPAIASYSLGQMAMFVLLGITLFLYFHRTRPWLAGAALLLCALKPHLFLPFWVALLAWTVTRKVYRVALGAMAAVVISWIVPLFFDPSIYSQYAAMASTSGVSDLFMPTMSALLRLAVNPNAFWIQFVPAFAGCIWAFWYFHRHRESWDWGRHGLLLIVVSFLVAPYAWYFDAVILLPSLLYAVYRVRFSALSVLILLLVAAAVQMQLAVQPNSAWYLWPDIAWPAWYLWAMRPGRSSASVASAA